MICGEELTELEKRQHDFPFFIKFLSLVTHRVHSFHSSALKKGIIMLVLGNYLLPSCLGCYWKNERNINK